MTAKEYFEQGLAKVKENDNEAVVKIFTKVLELEPKNADALSQRAVAYLNLEQYELSMFDMNLAVEYDPEYGFRYQCRGYLKARIQDFEGAVADYERAVELEPDDPIAYNNLALAQDQLGWASKAKLNYNKSDELAGFKSIEERAQARIEQNRKEEEKKSAEGTPTAKSTEEDAQSKSEIAKSVFRNRSSFREFMRFIGNGFKLKK